MMGMHLGKTRSRTTARAVGCLRFLCLTGGLKVGGGRLEVPLTGAELREVYRVSRPTWVDPPAELVARWDQVYRPVEGL